MIFTASASIFLLQANMIFSFLVENPNLVHDFIVSIVLLMSAIHARKLQYEVHLLQTDIDILLSIQDDNTNTALSQNDLPKYETKHNVNVPSYNVLNSGRYTCEDIYERLTSSQSDVKKLKKMVNKNNKSMTKKISSLKKHIDKEYVDINGLSRSDIQSIYFEINNIRETIRENIKDIEDELIAINELIKPAAATAATAAATAADADADADADDAPTKLEE